MKVKSHFYVVAALLLSLSAQFAHAAKPELEILVLFDNTSAREDLRRSWGFSALIDFRGHRVLFDAGSDPILLLEHLEKMQIDPKSIEHAVISHQHGDHLRGVYWVFEKNPKMDRDTETRVKLTNRPIKQGTARQAVPFLILGSGGWIRGAGG